MELQRLSVDRFDYADGLFGCDCSDGYRRFVTAISLEKHMHAGPDEKFPVVIYTSTDAAGEEVEHSQRMDLFEWMKHAGRADVCIELAAVLNKQAGRTSLENYKPIREGDFLPNNAFETLMNLCRPGNIQKPAA